MIQHGMNMITDCYEIKWCDQIEYVFRTGRYGTRASKYCVCIFQRSNKNAQCYFNAEIRIRNVLQALLTFVGGSCSGQRRYGTRARALRATRLAQGSPWRGAPLYSPKECLRGQEGGEGSVDWDTAASNCSTGNCLPNFNKRMSSKSSNWQTWARWGFQLYHPPFRREGGTILRCRLPSGLPSAVTRQSSGSLLYRILFDSWWKSHLKKDFRIVLFQMRWVRSNMKIMPWQRSQEKQRERESARAVSDVVFAWYRSCLRKCIHSWAPSVVLCKMWCIPSESNMSRIYNAWQESCCLLVNCNRLLLLGMHGGQRHVRSLACLLNDCAACCVSLRWCHRVLVRGNQPRIFALLFCFLCAVVLYCLFEPTVSTWLSLTVALRFVVSWWLIMLSPDQNVSRADPNFPMFPDLPTDGCHLLSRKHAREHRLIGQLQVCRRTFTMAGRGGLSMRVLGDLWFSCGNLGAPCEGPPSYKLISPDLALSIQALCWIVTPAPTTLDYDN